MRLLREYIRYPPPPDAILPWNHCVVGGVLPWLKPALSWLCNSV